MFVICFQYVFHMFFICQNPSSVSPTLTPQPLPPPARGFKMFYVLRYIPKAEITAVNYANLLNICFTLLSYE